MPAIATREPERAVPVGPLTSLPRVEDLTVAEQGFDQQKVHDAFEVFRRHLLHLQTQLRVLQAAGTSAQAEPSGHAVRMDALHLIRAAAEFADQLELDAQNASATQLRRTQEEVRRKQREVQSRGEQVERYRKDSEDQRAEIVSAARAEARELLAKANEDATRELQEAEARGTRLLEQARHQATELTNAVRAEVEQTLEWARAHANSIISRAQEGAGQLLGAAGLGSKHVATVVEAIVRSAEASAGGRAGPIAPQRQQPDLAEAGSEEPKPSASEPAADTEAAPATADGRGAEGESGSAERPDTPA